MKGGVAKTTSAIHLAAYLAEAGKTVLVDGDPNQSATRWAKRGEGNFAFDVVGVYKAASVASRYQHIVLDTKARPEVDELKDLAEGCDLLIVPTTPDPLGMEATMLTLDTLKRIGSDRFRVLLTVIPPDPIPEGREARRALEEASVPLFRVGIRRLIAFQRAVAEGTTVEHVRDERARLGWRDYERVGQEIISVVESRSHSVTAS
jgi:chromosome partitioning protein